MLLKTLRALLILSLLGFALVLVTALVQAHGATLTPMSRVYDCFLQNPETPDTLACQEAVNAGGTQPLYDWNEVNIRDVGGQHQARIPDGWLCSAGREKYRAFDQPRLDWATTVLPSGGNYTFVFTAAVPHNFGHFELFVTRDGWDPLQPLKWSDLDPTPFLFVNEPPLVNGAYSFSGTLPAKTGRHLIYTIWQRHDSAEAFYSCSDVWFGPGPLPTPTNPPACTAPAWNSSIVYQGGSEVSHSGRMWRAKWSNVSTEPSTVPNVNPWQLTGYCSGSGGSTPTNTPIGPTNTPTRTPTPTNTPIGPTSTPTRTPTRTNTPIGPTATPTRTPTRTNTPIGPTATPTRTPTPGGGACSPVTSTIAAPFAFDGAGTFCWQASSLGSFVNSWNMARLTINGVDFTNRWASSGSYPPPINGFWYISYTGNFPWSHFETR